MRVLDQVRYFMALLTVISLPPALLYWFILHPFVDAWRAVGRATTFAFLIVMFVGVGYLVYRMRGPILAVDYGTNAWLWAPAVALYAGAVWIQRRIRKQLTFRVLAGVPELDPSGHGGELLSEGLYARIRHPRYVAVMLGTVSWALFTNFLAMYLVVPVTALGLLAIARLEERELVDRFGEEYEAYRRRVPMFIPRLGAAEQTQ